MTWTKAKTAGVHVQQGLSHPHATISYITTHTHIPYLTYLWYASLLLTGGLLWLVKLWKPQWIVWMFMHPTPLRMAEVVLVFHEGVNVFEEETFEVSRC